MKVIEFIFNCWPLILIGLVVAAWLLGTVSDLWTVISKSKREDDEEKVNRVGFEQIKVRMFGTERENARERLNKTWRGLLMVLGTIVFWAALGWLLYGVVLLCRHFFA